ncbi:hypothetical protein BaRGS_00014585, partial [Batillaria attramentaria]
MKEQDDCILSLMQWQRRPNFSSLSVPLSTDCSGIQDRCPGVPLDLGTRSGIGIQFLKLTATADQIAHSSVITARMARDQIGTGTCAPFHRLRAVTDFCFG